MEQAVALVLASFVGLFALYTIRKQLQTFSQLRSEPHMPSVDQQFLRSQSQRRCVNSFFMLLLSGVLFWTYLSGNEHRANVMAEEHDRRIAEGGAQVHRTPEKEAFMRSYAIFWISVLILLFIIISLAVLDIWATRRYALKEYSRIRDDHKALLERDLALYKQQKRERLNGRGGLGANE